MIDLEFSLLLASLAPAAPQPVETPTAATAAATAIDALVIDAEVADLIALEAAVRLRVGCPVSRSDRARPPRSGELFAYLEITPAADARTTVRLTLADGRAWLRTIEGPPEDRTREIATTVGNLFAGIEVDAIAPDLRDVPLPVPLQPAAPVVAIAPPLAPVPLVPRRESGVAVDGLVLAGLGPPPPAGVAAGALAVRGGMRWRSGALVVAGLRAGVRANHGYTLTRLRVEIGGGHGWHRGAFALHTSVGFTIEPWFVTSSGSIAADANRRPVGALLGGVLRLAPMWRGRVGSRTKARSLTIGPFVEVGGSAMAGPDGGIARVRAAANDAIVQVFRVGGLELAAGLTIGLWRPARPLN